MDRFIGDIASMVAQKWRRHSAGIADSAWIFGPGLIGGPVGLISTIILLRSFDLDSVGQYFFSLALLGALNGFGLPGLSTALISSLARGDFYDFVRAARVKFLASLIVSIGISVFLLIGGESALISSRVLIALAALFPLLSADCGFQAMNGLRMFRTHAALSLLTRLLNLLFLGIAVEFEARIQSYLVVVWGWQAALNLVTTGFFYYRFKEAKSSNLQSFHYGLNLTASNILLQPISQLDKILVGTLVGTESLAVFSVGEKILAYLKSLGSQLHRIYYPRVARRSIAETGQFLVRHCIGWALVFLALSGLLALILPPVFLIALGSSYLPSAWYAVLFSIAFVLGVPGYFLSIFFREAHAVKETYLYSLAKIPLHLLGIFVGGSLGGVGGLPYGRIASVFCHSLVGLQLGMKVYGTVAHQLEPPPVSVPPSRLV